MNLLRRASRTILIAMALASSPLAFGSAQIVLTLNPSLSPSAARLLENTAGSFTATAVAGPNSTNVTALVRSWTSSNTAVATIDSAGHVTAQSPGSTTITATLAGAVRGSAVLTVTVPTNPVFTNQPADTFVSAIIDAGAGVKVQLADNLADPLPGLTVTMSIGTNGGQRGTGVLGGTLKHATDTFGTASFADLTIDWLGVGYTLVATVATPTGPLSSTSNPFNETRVGDACLGPSPACSSTCTDTDGDGLNDAWEIAGGIDLNGDGIITDAQHDVLLPGSDANRPDVYLKYDYMVKTGDGAHSHQPPAAAIQQVVDAYAAHGVNLHIDPVHDAIPEVQVTTLDPAPSLACAGPSFVTMQTLRRQYFGNRKWAYHYGVFAHNATLPDTVPNGNACPIDPECLGHTNPDNSGSSELPGSSFIVAFGNDVDNGFQVGIERWAGTFMHELGHNFGLKHGSLAAPGLQACLLYKPNFISVMDYLYQNGIGTAAQPGSVAHFGCSTDSDCPAGGHCTDDLGGPGGGNVCYRVDYSGQKLLDLNEVSLNETLGVGGSAGDTDIVQYCASAVGCSLSGPSNGPIDWNNNGDAMETNAAGDIDNDDNNPDRTLLTANDWEISNGAFENFNFKFQCTTAFAADSGAGAAADQVQSSSTPSELGSKYAREHHILYPPRNVKISVNPACSSRLIAPGPLGTFKVALLGATDFDVNQVDPESLSFHGAKPVNVSVGDANRDGIPDLIAEFPNGTVRLSPRATHGTLTGWLKNSRAFFGSDEVVVVPSLAMVDEGCR